MWFLARELDRCSHRQRRCLRANIALTTSGAAPANTEEMKPRNASLSGAEARRLVFVNVKPMSVCDP